MIFIIFRRLNSYIFFVLAIIFAPPQICFGDIDMDENFDSDEVENSDIEGLDDKNESSFEEFNVDFPINLNECSYEQLICIPSLSENEAKSIIDHRDEFGEFISIYELQAVKNLDIEVIKNCSPYLFVHDSPNDPRNFLTNSQPKDITIKSFMAIPNKEEKNPLGYAIDCSVSVRKKSLNWNWGLTGKKSSFEEFSIDHKTRRYFFNRYRAHLMYSNKAKILKNIIVGNYTIGFGEGLLLCNGMSMKSPLDCIKISKGSAKIIKPYTSPNSIKFFGAYAQISTKHFDFHPFISFIPLDGKLDQEKKILNSKSNKDQFCYDKKAKLDKRNSYNEQILGFAAINSSLFKRASLGYSLLFTNYSVNVVPRSADKYIFSGDRAFMQSLFYNFGWKNLYFFGEAAFSKNFSKNTLQKKVWAPGILNGLIISISKYLDLSLLHRFYSKYFISLYGGPVRQNQSACNEKAIYFGFRVKPSYKLFFDFSQDAAKKITDESAKIPYSFIWRASARYQPNKEFFIQFVTKNKILNKKNNATYKNSKKKAHNSKMQVGYNLTKSINLKSEIIFNTAKEDNNPYQNGYGAFQNVVWRFWNFKIKARAGYVYAENKDSQIYTFDPAMKLTSGQKGYMGEGIVGILVLQYKILDNLCFETRFSIFNKNISPNDKNKNIPMKLEFQLFYSL